MSSIMASQIPVTDQEICGDVPMKTTEPSAVDSGEVSTTFTPINGQAETAVTHQDESEAGLEKVSLSSYFHPMVDHHNPG